MLLDNFPIKKSSLSNLAVFSSPNTALSCSSWSAALAPFLTSTPTSSKQFGDFACPPYAIDSGVSPSLFFRSSYKRQVGYRFALLACATLIIIYIYIYIYISDVEHTWIPFSDKSTCKQFLRLSVHVSQPTCTHLLASLCKHVFPSDPHELISAPLSSIH